MVKLRKPFEFHSETTDEGTDLYGYIDLYWLFGILTVIIIVVIYLHGR